MSAKPTSSCQFQPATRYTMPRITSAHFFDAQDSHLMAAGTSYMLCKAGEGLNTLIQGFARAVANRPLATERVTP